MADYLNAGGNMTPSPQRHHAYREREIRKLWMALRGTVKDELPIINPTVTVNQGPAQTDPATGTSVVFQAVFSEAMSGFFLAADVVLSGTALPATAIISTLDNITFTITVSGMVNPGGTVIVDILAGVAVSQVTGLPNLASTSTDNEVTWWPTAPFLMGQYPLTDADFVIPYGVYIVAAVGPGGAGNGYLAVLDFTTPWAPTLVGTSAVNADWDGTGDGVIVGDHVILGYEGWVYFIYNLSNPASPVKETGTLGGSNTIEVIGPDHVLTGERISDRIRSHNVSNKSSVTTASTLTSSTAFDTPVGLVAWDDGTYALVVSNTDNMVTVINTTTKTALAIAGSVVGANAGQFTSWATCYHDADNDLVYVAVNQSNGIRFSTVDVSTPATPVVVDYKVMSESGGSGVPRSFFTKIGNTLWLGETGARRIVEIDVTTPTNPTVVAWHPANFMGRDGFASAQEHPADVTTVTTSTGVHNVAVSAYLNQVSVYYLPPRP